MTEDDALLAGARELTRHGRGRRERERYGVSLEELAAAVGVPVIELMAWELGEREPAGSEAADYLRVVRALARHHDGPA